MSVDLASALAPLLAPVQDMFWAGFVVFLRLGTMMALLPLFGEQAVPVRIRLALAFAFTLVVAPAVAASLPDPGGPGRFLALLLGEAAAGLALGLLLRLLVIALQTAGAIAGQATSLSQLFGAGPGGEPSPAMGHLLVMGGLALAAAMGLHIRLALWMVDGYALIPAGAVLDPGLMLEAGLGGVTRAFTLAVSLAVPFVAAALLYNVVLGVINRAMPQLMVTFVGAPALTFGGLVLMAIALPVLLDVWGAALEAALALPGGDLP